MVLAVPRDEPMQEDGPTKIDAVLIIQSPQHPKKGDSPDVVIDEQQDEEMEEAKEAEEALVVKNLSNGTV
jgi:hypothetical protein